MAEMYWQEALKYSTRQNKEYTDKKTTIEKGGVKISLKEEVSGLKTYVTPEMFGAKGDGVTDDIEAIQSAIDYAIENNLNFLCNGKVYAISRTVVIKDTTGIVFDFGCATFNVVELKKYGTTNVNDIIIRYSAFVIDNCANCILKNIEVDLNVPSADANLDSYGVVMSRLNDCIFDNIEFRNGTFHFIYIYKDVIATMRNIRFLNLCKNGTHANNSDIYANGEDNRVDFFNVSSVRDTFVGSQCFYMADGAYSVKNLYCKNVIIPLDQRYGKLVAENIEAHNVGTIMVRSYDNPAKKTADVIIRDMRCYGLVKNASNISNIIYITACSSLLLENVYVELAEDISTGINIRDFRPSGNKTVDNVTIQNVVINSGEHANTYGCNFNNIFDDVKLYINRVFGLKSLNTTTNAILIYGNDANFVPILEDVVIANSNGRAFNGTTSLEYFNIVSKKNLAKFGTTEDRPKLQRFDRGYQFYDSAVAKTVVWNGTAWV